MSVATANNESSYATLSWAWGDPLPYEKLNPLLEPYGCRIVEIIAEDPSQEICRVEPLTLKVSGWAEKLSTYERECDIEDILTENTTKLNDT